MSRSFLIITALATSVASCVSLSREGNSSSRTELTIEGRVSVILNVEEEGGIKREVKRIPTEPDHGS